MAGAEDRSAPEGAECRQHPARRAFFTCPRCGHHVCLVCWQDIVDRCHACIARDPTAGIEPLPWEQPDRPVLVRYLATLATALRPRRSAPAFAYDDRPSALRFLLLSALPLAMLVGIIPHTRTLLFGGSFGVSVVGTPSAGLVALDVARAAALQIVLTGIELACLALPFVSLVRAYGSPGRAHAALRVVLYRGWLVPFAWLVFYVGTWALPAPALPLSPDAEPTSGLTVFHLMRDLIPLLLLLAMVATARLSCGLGPLISMVVVLIPALLFALVGPLATVTAVQQLLPAAPQP
jgi:hypothetical protein